LQTTLVFCEKPPHGSIGGTLTTSLFSGRARPQASGGTMKKEEILAKLAAGEMNVDEASKLLAEIEQPKRGTLYCKVSEKGAVSVYGLQRMPVTLYVEQWDRLLAFADDLKQFLKDNDSKLKRKGQEK
jgi:hypothetical protein